MLFLFILKIYSSQSYNSTIIKNVHHSQNAHKVLKEKQQSNNSQILLLDGSCGSSLTYTINGNILTIVGSGAMTSYTEENLPPWHANELIEKVILPEGMTSISMYGFSNLVNMMSINIPTSVTTLGDFTFRYCYKLESITFPPSITVIPPGCLYTCSSLLSVDIQGQVSSIENSAFGYCSNLTALEIPKTCAVIGTHAFRGCDKLTTITIPPQVTVIDEYILYECATLESVEIEGNLASIGERSFSKCPKLTSLYYKGTSDCTYKTDSFIDSPISIVYVTGSYSPTQFCGFTVTLHPSFYPSCGPNLTYYISGTRLSFYGGGEMEDYDENSLPPWYSNKGNIESVELPDLITHIGNYAFKDFIKLTSITIPDNVESLGQSAFYNCTSLSTIKIPSKITLIPYYLFYSCSKLTDVEFLGDKIEKFEERVFQYCTSLAKITLPQSLLELGQYAFGHCISLESITIPTSLVAIKEGCFYNCLKMKTINMNSNLETIGVAAFNSCSSLKSVTIPPKVTFINSLFGTCANLSHVEFLGNVTVISHYSFHLCKYLATLTIPQSVVEIHDHAFEESGIQLIVIPAKVSMINESLFNKCFSLISIEINGDLSSIGENAFKHCPFLESFYYKGTTNPSYSNNSFLYTGVSNVFVTRNYEYDSFCGFPTRLHPSLVTPSLSPLATPAATPDITPIATPFATPSSSPIATPMGYPMIMLVDYLNEGYWSSYRINDRSAWTVTSNSEQTTSAAIEGPATNIIDGQQETFWHSKYNDALAGGHDDRPQATDPFQFTIDLGQETTFRAFSYTPRQKGEAGWQNGIFIHYEFYVANTKEELDTKIQERNYISNGDFEYTSQESSTDQTSLVIYPEPKTGRFIALLSVNHNNYASCSEFNLYSDPPATPFPSPSMVIVPCGPSLYYSIKDATLILNGEGDMSNYTDDDHAPWYSNRTIIEKVELPELITSIGSYAFDKFSLMTTITIPSNVVSIGKAAFYDCIKLASITIPSSVVSIDTNAFYACKSLTEIIIPTNLESLGTGTFAYCSSLESITIPPKVTIINEDLFKECTKLSQIEIQGDVTSIGMNAFYKCTSLKSFTIPPNVTSIGESAFQGTRLQSIIIPSKVETIGKSTFRNCEGLTTIAIPPKVTRIEEYLFYECSNLESIEIPGDVSSIGKFTFAYCTSLNSMTIESSSAQILSFSLEFLEDSPIITIPSKVTRIEDSLFYGCTSIKSIVIEGNLLSIGSDAFGDCVNLSSIYYKGTSNPSYNTTSSFANTHVDNVFVTRNYEQETFCDIRASLHPSLITQSPTASGSPTASHSPSCSPSPTPSFSPSETPTASESPTQSIKDVTTSMTFSFSFVSVKTVVFTMTQVASNTHILHYDEGEQTYIYELTKTDVYQLLPYIIYSLSRTYIHSYMQLDLEKRKVITPERLIGIVCGSVGIFFIVLAVIIFIYRKKREVKSYNEELTFSSDEFEGNETMLTNITLTNYNNQANDDAWV